MKTIRLHARGGPEAIVCEDAPMPAPAAGEIRVRVHAAAVTPTELAWAPTWTTRDGRPRPFPIVPGHEFSGEIDALGAGVGEWRRGDAVFGLNDWFRDGAQAEYCLARAVDVARPPRSVDHVHAAVVPISALTAWQGLIVRARVAAGQRVLVHGASGGVGLFAVQIARARGAHVIGTASAANRDFVRELGAAEVLEYRTTRFDDVVRDVDVVFDTVGGDTLARSWRVLRPRGTMITIATSEEPARDARVRAAFFIVEPDRAQLDEIARRIDAGELRPVVGAVVPLAEARRAYETKPARGKTVLRMVG
jgi:NADPH:quinone reductase-like Zn-dependent oxidoreductase